MYRFESTSESEDVYVETLNSALIDRALLALTVFGLIGAVVLVLRISTIGFSERDVIQFSLVGCMIILAAMRNRIPVRVKRTALIAWLFAAGLSGLMSLGLMAGTILLFPVLFVVLATLYRSRVATCYSFLIIALLAAAAVRFHSGAGAESAALLASNYPHWAVYISCMVCFFLVSHKVIYTYKEETRRYHRQLETRNRELAESNGKLEKAMAEIEVLEGLLPICSHCKKVRDDNGYWNQIESYISDRSPVMFSHSICQECMEKYYGDLFEDDEEQERENQPTSG